jgi:hypothetical protein
MRYFPGGILGDAQTEGDAALMLVAARQVHGRSKMRDH